MQLSTVYGANAILIVNTAEYLCMETSSKVSNELLLGRPPLEEVKLGEIASYVAKGA